MNFVHFILLALLGLLNLSAAAVPGQVVDVANGNEAGHDLDLAVGNDLVARQSYPSGLLRWGLKCALDPDKTEPAPGKKKAFVKDEWCRRYFICTADGKKDFNPDRRWPKVGTRPWENRKWCNDWCECVLLDQPERHPDENLGCVSIKQEEGVLPGIFGSVSRDTDPAPGDDGLVLEPFEGPRRKD